MDVLRLKMTEKKRRQDQRGAAPKEICPKCKKEYLKIAAGREEKIWARIGQYCPNPSCDYIIKDLVELKEEAEQGTEQGDELKKRTAEFIFLHEQLNELAEQINALEKAAHGGQPTHMRHEGTEG
jgi:hypothetical protein